MKLSYSQKLYYKTVGKLLIVPATAFAVGIGFLALGVHNSIALGVPLAGMVGFALGFVFYPLNLRAVKITDKFVDPVYEKYFEGALTEQRDAARRGMEGERVVSGWLEEILPKSDWTVIKNREFKGNNDSKFDIDIVIIGPKGVFVFEVKNSSYDFLFTEKDCAVLVGDQYRHYSGVDPRQQAANNADTIEKRLKAGGLRGIRTKRAVVFVRPNSIRFLGKPTVFLIDNKNTLKRYLLGSPSDSRFTPEFRENVKNVILAS